MGWVFGIGWFYSKLSVLRDGGLADVKASDRTLSYWGLEFHSRAIIGSVQVCWVVKLSRVYYVTPSFLPILDFQLRFVYALQASLNDWLEGGRPRFVHSVLKLYKEVMCRGLPEGPSEASIPSYAVVVSAVVLLSLVYRYLTGNVDIGSSEAYSRCSLDVRDIYVAVATATRGIQDSHFSAQLSALSSAVINQGVPSFEVEIELSTPQQNHPGLMALPSVEAEAQGALI